MNPDEMKTCIICKEDKSDGITIVNAFVCRSCESEMVHTNVEDGRYPFFVQQLKQIWVRFDA